MYCCGTFGTVVELCANCCSVVGSGKLARLGVKGDCAAEVGALIGFDELACPMPASAVSSLVIAKPLGTLLDPLAFLFFDVGPAEEDGEVWRDMFRGVMVAEVVCDG